MSNSEVRLYIKPVTRSVSKNDVSDVFSKFGSIYEIKLMDGYGFVEFEQADDASKAVDELNNSDFFGESLQVAYARSSDRRDDRRDSRRETPKEIILYRVGINNLSSDTTWQDLKDHFRSQDVDVAFCDVSRDRDGTGYIDLQSKEEVERVVKEYADSVINDSKVDLKDDGIVHRRAPKVRENRDRRDRDFRRDGRRDDRRRDRRDFDRRDRRDDRRDDRRGGDRRDDRRDDRRGRDRRDDRRGSDRGRRDDRRDGFRRDDDRRHRGRRDSRDDSRDRNDDKNRSRSRSRSRSRQRSKSPVNHRDYTPEPMDTKPDGDADNGKDANYEGSW